MESDEQTNDQMSDGEQKLQQLEFSDPVCWCESTGRYTNEQGQVFELRVRGTDVERVKEYMNAVRVSFEVVPVKEETQEPEEPSEEVDEKTRSYIEEGLKNLERHPELDLEITMGVVDTQGVELPYELNAVIDPPIAGGATDNHVTRDKVKKIKITLHANQEGGVTGSLNGGDPQQADTYPPNPPKSSTKFKGESTPASQFSFAVTGLKTNNKYSISTSARLERV